MKLVSQCEMRPLALCLPRSLPALRPSDTEGKPVKLGRGGFLGPTSSARTMLLDLKTQRRIQPPWMSRTEVESRVPVVSRAQASAPLEIPKHSLPACGLHRDLHSLWSRSKGCLLLDPEHQSPSPPLLKTACPTPPKARRQSDFLRPARLQFLTQPQ